MKRFQVKVCGNNSVENFKALTKIEPDYVGFIFYPKSPRFIKDESIFEIFPNAERVGVFVNESVEKIIQKVKQFELDVVQLHGDETPSFCQELIEAKHQQLLTSEQFLDFKIWKAIGVNETTDFEQLKGYQQVVDSFVLDTKSTQYGGSGKKFDWQLLKNYQLSTPFLLSGGIQLEDALVLKNFKHPQCIGFDINSGFEIEPGIKNIEKVKQFIDTIDGRIEQN
ncbi:phosphoribosylanthranilate isomerase [Faecalibacter macacae]|uniref:N-(5'-phosphoribosyl)anthranilate isomerase n=1 Tax=Faecalibacter macacae TaxID=1859289 RepID=A0A3L9MAQ1_9FLAO|nr:phosphoribosylanthranilate isomerase [Faecalibacter macacae]RLZ08334.1 phosphoribosylanthranilate isomerase [Faecalibacter macacae]